MKDESDEPVQQRFADLMRFADWALPTTLARIEKRKSSSREEICAFYEGVVPKMDEALEYLNQFPLSEIPRPAMPIYYIALSLAEVAPYVEWFEGQNKSPSVNQSTLDFTLVDEPRP